MRDNRYTKHAPVVYGCSSPGLSYCEQVFESDFGQGKIHLTLF
jgi:hypothetical protein